MGLFGMGNKLTIILFVNYTTLADFSASYIATFIEVKNKKRAAMNDVNAESNNRIVYKD